MLYPTPTAYQGVLADVSIATGWCTIVMMFLGRWVFQLLGWAAAAAATPAIMLASGAAFFGLSMAANAGLSVWGLDPAGMGLAGAAAGAVTQVGRVDRWSDWQQQQQQHWRRISLAFHPSGPPDTTPTHMRRCLRAP